MAPVAGSNHSSVLVYLRLLGIFILRLLVRIGVFGERKRRTNIFVRLCNGPERFVLRVWVSIRRKSTGYSTLCSALAPSVSRAGLSRGMWHRVRLPESFAWLRLSRLAPSVLRWP